MNAQCSKHMFSVYTVMMYEDEQPEKKKSHFVERLHESLLLTPSNLLNPPPVLPQDIRRGPVGVTPVKRGS